MIKNYFNYIKETTNSEIGKTSFKTILNSIYYDEERCELFCYGNDLISLDGIDFFQNVVLAHLNDNNLDNLDGIQHCKNLKMLNCSINNLTHIEEILNLKNINALNVGFNLISDLTGIRELSDLEYFYCQNNLLESFEFGNFSIDAIELGIDRTDLVRFKKLKILTCYNNLFSYRYEKYIKDYCSNKKIHLNIHNIKIPYSKKNNRDYTNGIDKNTFAGEEINFLIP